MQDILIAFEQNPTPGPACMYSMCAIGKASACLTWWSSSSSVPASVSVAKYYVVSRLCSCLVTTAGRLPFEAQQVPATVPVYTYPNKVHTQYLPTLRSLYTYSVLTTWSCDQDSSRCGPQEEVDRWTLLIIFFAPIPLLHAPLGGPTPALFISPVAPSHMRCCPFLVIRKNTWAKHTIAPQAANKKERTHKFHLQYLSNEIAKKYSKS